MKVMRRSRWLARLAATLVVGVAGLVAVASARPGPGSCSSRMARPAGATTATVTWATGPRTSDRSIGDIRFANDVLQVAAG